MGEQIKKTLNSNDPKKTRASKKDLLYRFPGLLVSLLGIVVYIIEIVFQFQAPNIIVIGDKAITLVGFLVVSGMIWFGIASARDMLDIYKAYKEIKKDG